MRVAKQAEIGAGAPIKLSCENALAARGPQQRPWPISAGAGVSAGKAARLPRRKQRRWPVLPRGARRRSLSVRGWGRGRGRVGGWGGWGPGRRRPVCRRRGRALVLGPATNDVEIRAEVWFSPAKAGNESQEDAEVLGAPRGHHCFFPPSPPFLCASVGALPGHHFPG